MLDFCGDNEYNLYMSSCNVLDVMNTPCCIARDCNRRGKLCCGHTVPSNGDCIARDCNGNEDRKTA